VASPSWYNDGSLAAACAVQPGDGVSRFFENNNQPVATVPTSKAMATPSQHSNSRIAAALAAQSVMVPYEIKNI